MLCAHLGKILASGIGIAAGFFLTMAQIGLLLGWIDTSTLPIQRAEVDIWIMGQKSPAFDYGSPIPRHHLYQARSIRGVDETYPLIMTWSIWSRPDGRKVNIELVGVGERLVGAPLEMEEGLRDALRREKTVIVDSMYLDLLGVSEVGERFEILGRRCQVGGVSKGVRTFTASPFVFASIRDAIYYDKRIRPDELSYVLVRCEEDADVSDVAARIREQITTVEVLTSRQFMRRSAEYWMIGTGIGFTVIVTAILGLVIGALVISQSLFNLLNDHKSIYATMLAIGFSVRKLGAIIFWQAGFLWLIGLVLGGTGFLIAAGVADLTPIPLKMTGTVLAVLLLSQFLVTFGAGLGILRKLYRIDPVSVFEG